MAITESTTRTIEPDITVVTVSGRLSLGNSLLSLESGIRHAVAVGIRKLIVDLAGLTSIDSAGVGVLIGCNGEMEKAGGQFRIAGAAGMVKKVFDTVHMGRVVPLDPDVDSACRAFSDSKQAPISGEKP